MVGCDDVSVRGDDVSVSGGDDVSVSGGDDVSVSGGDDVSVSEYHYVCGALITTPTKKKRIKNFDFCN